MQLDTRRKFSIVKESPKASELDIGYIPPTKLTAVPSLTNLATSMTPDVDGVADWWWFVKESG
jgi:hypothetical protein